MSSSSVRTIERLRTEKYQQREKAWNKDVGFAAEKKRLVQMSSDIKSFILRSMSDPIETQRAIEHNQRKHRELTDSFSKISETLGFIHHDGTDRNLELKVVKIIMIREGLIMNLQYLSERAFKNKGVDGSNILELMFQLRETTLNYLEALCLWRQGSNQGDMPRAFLWESQNYTIKLINDMDFLAENSYIINALNIPPEQLKSNPLMLSNNLEDFNTWMDPHERASQDTNGNTAGPEFESRLRLRFAERVLLQEMELYNSIGESDIFITQGNDYVTDIPYPPQQDGYFYDDSNKYVYMNQGGAPTTQNEKVMIGSNILEEDGSGFNDNPMLDNEPQGTSETIRSNPFFDGERRVKTTESAFPQSRSSTATQGFSSAPSTSHGNTFSSGGHDCFAGNWNDGKGDLFPFFDRQVDLPRDDGDLYHPQALHPKSGVEGKSSSQYGGFTMMIQTEFDHEKDAVSVAKSAKSIDSVSDLDMRLIMGLHPPSPSLILAGSVCIILFSDKEEIPEDLSWRAFSKLTKKIDLAAAMSSLQPEKVHKFKIIAIQPILEQLMEEVTLDSLKNNNYPFQEYIALNRFLTWVKQFTSSAIRKEMKQHATSPFKEDLVKKKKVDNEIERKKSAGKNLKAKGKVALTPIRNDPKESMKNIRHMKSPDVIESLPKGKKVAVPKVPTDLCPFHKEMIEGKFKNAILLALLTTPEAISEEPSDYDNLRVVVKVYDIVLSAEAICNLNMREHILLREELCKKYSISVQQYFAPTDLTWWRKNIQHVMSLKYSSDGVMKLKISQKMIEELIVSRMNSDGIDAQLIQGSYSSDEVDTPIVKKSSSVVDSKTKTISSTKTKETKGGQEKKKTSSADIIKPMSEKAQEVSNTSKPKETAKKQEPAKKGGTVRKTNGEDVSKQQSNVEKFSSSQQKQIPEPPPPTIDVQTSIAFSFDNPLVDSTQVEGDQAIADSAVEQTFEVEETKEESPHSDKHDDYTDDFANTHEDIQKNELTTSLHKNDEYGTDFSSPQKDHVEMTLQHEANQQTEDFYEQDFDASFHHDPELTVEVAPKLEAQKVDGGDGNGAGDEVYDDGEFAAEHETKEPSLGIETDGLEGNIQAVVGKEDDLSLYGSDFEIDGNHVEMEAETNVPRDDGSLYMDISGEFDRKHEAKLENVGDEKKSSNQLEDEQAELHMYLQDDKAEEYNDVEFDEEIPPINEILLSDKVKMRVSQEFSANNQDQIVSFDHE